MRNVSLDLIFKSWICYLCHQGKDNDTVFLTFKHPSTDFSGDFFFLSHFSFILFVKWCEVGKKSEYGKKEKTWDFSVESCHFYSWLGLQLFDNLEKKSSLLSTGLGQMTKFWRLFPFRFIKTKRSHLRLLFIYFISLFIELVNPKSAFKAFSMF